MGKLFFDRNKHTCVYVVNKEEQIFCHKCCVELIESVTVQQSWSKIMPIKTTLYCDKCIRMNVKRDMDVFMFANIETEVLDSYKLINEMPPELKKGEIDLFQAAHLPSEKVTDKSKLAKYASIEGAKVGDMNYIGKKSESLNKAKADLFLDVLKDSKPVLPKQLEGKNANQ